MEPGNDNSNADLIFEGEPEFLAYVGLNELFLSKVPSADLSLDEALVLHKGRLEFKTFIRTKRSRFGVKLYVLAESFGYILYATVYFGKNSDDSTGDFPAHLSKSERIVADLLHHSNLLDKGYVVHIDNWYCSLRLVEYLYNQRKTGVRGTVRVCRGIPLELQGKKQARWAYYLHTQRTHPCCQIQRYKGHVRIVKRRSCWLY